MRRVSPRKLPPAIQHIAADVVMTIAVGAAAIAAAPLIVSAPAWVPLVGGATLVAAILGVTGWALAEHAPQWIKDGEVVWNASKYSAEEVAKAHEGLRGFGKGFVNLGAEIVSGGWMYGKMAGTIKGAFETATTNLATKQTAAIESALLQRIDDAAAAKGMNPQEYIYTAMDDPGDVIS